MRLEKIVGRLLQDGHISTEEAIFLLSKETTKAKEDTKPMVEIERPKNDIKAEEEKIKDAIIQEIIKKQEERDKLKFIPLEPYNPYKPHPFSPYYPTDPNKVIGMKRYGDICPCNPNNGGNGICNCVMGNEPIDSSVFDPKPVALVTDITTNFEAPFDSRSSCSSHYFQTDSWKHPTNTSIQTGDKHE